MTRKAKRNKSCRWAGKGKHRVCMCAGRRKFAKHSRCRGKKR